MARRKGTPEAPPVADAGGVGGGGPTEETPPAPPPKEGDDKNPELEKRRKDVAKGIWDPKHSAALAKQLPSDKLVAQWEPIGEMFATMTDVVVLVLFGPSEALKNIGALSEREMLVQAWAARLAVEPPENIKQILTINLVAVYCFVFLPRVQRVWAKQVEDMEPSLAKAIKGKVQDAGRKEVKDDRGARGGPESHKGDAGRGAGAQGETGPAAKA